MALTIRTGRTLSFYTFPSANFFCGVYSNPAKRWGWKQKMLENFPADPTAFSAIDCFSAFDLFPGTTLRPGECADPAAAEAK